MFTPKSHCRIILAVLSLMAVLQANGAGTAAGTLVQNHVEVSYQMGEDPNAIHVETASHGFIVSELIRSNVSALEPQGVGTTTPASNAVLSFEVTNTGNGQETFYLTSQGGLADQFKTEATSIWIESNGTPGWQADDTSVEQGTDGVPLAADESVIAYVVSDIPADLEDESTSDMTLVSTSATPRADQQAVGGSLSQAGDGGIEAVVAQDKASHQDTSHYSISMVTVDVTKRITKVVDPYGGDLAMPGSEVTYQIRVTAGGRGTVNDLVVEDAVPDSMRYKNNTLTFNGAYLTDTSDDDFGRFDTQQSVAFFTPGTMVAPQVQEYSLTYIVE